MADFDLSASFIPSLHKPASLLPIARHRQNLLYLIETYPIAIVVGQTGSGKTTQIPQFLEQAGWCSDGKVIAVTQVIISKSSSLTQKLLTYSSLVE
jgi:ATP-dependent RNA helicase DDX35